MRSDRHGAAVPTRSAVVAAAGLLLLGAAPARAQQPAAEPSDLLRFEVSGDSLHGKFLGMPESALIRWRHPNARDAIVLETGDLRHLALNGGRARQTLHSTSYVHLHGGDRLPGRIVDLDAQKLVIETEVAGVVTVQRSFIRQIAPNPHGGAVHYVGPFAADDWTVIEPADPEGGTALSERVDDPPPPPDEIEEDKKEEGAEEAGEGPWVFSGGAYYSNSELPIAVDTHAPDKTRIRFRLAWRNRLNAAIAFHATMRRPDKPDPGEAENPGGEEPGKEDPKAAARRLILRESNNTNAFPAIFGESYVLTVFQNYVQLYRCSFDDDGEPEVIRLATSGSNLRFEEAGDAEFELRCDRQERSIAFFADGSFVSQWEDRHGDGYAGTGSHFAIACQNSSSRLRISEVVVTSWNGMIDSARSMEAEDRDIVLLTNGTDRFSGDVLALEDGKFRVAGTYSEMLIPIEDVQEIRLAPQAETEDPEGSQGEDPVRVLLQPFGRLTVVPIEATAERMKARHASLGELDLDLRFSGLIEFSFSDSVLDSWDDDF